MARRLKEQARRRSSITRVSRHAFIALAVLHSMPRECRSREYDACTLWYLIWEHSDCLVLNKHNCVDSTHTGDILHTFTNMETRMSLFCQCNTPVAVWTNSVASYFSGAYCCDHTVTGGRPWHATFLLPVNLAWSLPPDASELLHCLIPVFNSLHRLGYNLGLYFSPSQQIDHRKPEIAGSCTLLLSLQQRNKA